MVDKKGSGETPITSFVGDERFLGLKYTGGTPSSEVWEIQGMLAAIPVSIVSDTDDTDSLGSVAKAWKAFLGYAVRLKEKAAASADVAGWGELWVKTATPNQLWFTDDAGIDHRISGEHKIARTVWNPVGVQGEDTQIPFFRADAAITITRIHISGPNASPSTELDIDLKWADDTTAWTNGTVIDVCDTTNGVVTITTGFDDATVASGKHLYWEFGAAPHADWLWFYFEVYYTYD